MKSGNRRSRKATSHMESSGAMVLALGGGVGVLAILGALVPNELPVDIPAMGAYAAIFVVVGMTMFLRGE